MGSALAKKETIDGQLKYSKVEGDIIFKDNNTRKIQTQGSYDTKTVSLPKKLLSALDIPPYVEFNEGFWEVIRQRDGIIKLIFTPILYITSSKEAE